MSYPSVLVLDSGVGGLSIAGKIRELCAPVQIDYLADLAGFPYGIKSEQELLQRVVGLLERSLPVYQPQVVVIACNTASTLVLEELRRRFPVPFVGVVPAIKPAAQLSQTGVLAVLATKGTVNREYTHKLIQDFAQNKKVLLHGSAQLVLLAEQKLMGHAPDPKDLDHEVTSLKNVRELDTVVLACTHFPLLREELRKALPQVRFWVDSGEAIARRVQYWLHHLGATTHNPHNKPINQFLFNGLEDFKYNTGLIEEYLGMFDINKIP